MQVTLKNNRYHTQCAARPKVKLNGAIYFSPHQVIRIRNILCGEKPCPNLLGISGPQIFGPYEIDDGENGSVFIYADSIRIDNGVELDEWT